MVNMNSVKNSLDEDDRLSGMRLLMMNPINDNKTLIILEGITDIRFFNTYRLDNRFIYESPESGKEGVINSVAALREVGISAVYGVCDADFDPIIGVQYPGVFYTDDHDLEMMLVKGGVVKKFILMYTHARYTQGELAESFFDSVNDNIISACYTIGLLKLYNFLNSSGLRFKGMKHRDFVSVNGLNISVDINKYIECVFDRSEVKPGRPNAEEIKKEIETLRERDISYLSICNGHDFMSLVKILYDTELSTNKNMRLDEIDSYMRISYEQKSFQQTTLHQSLCGLLV